jgi:hypothetical protein
MASSSKKTNELIEKVLAELADVKSTLKRLEQDSKKSDHIINLCQVSVDALTSRVANMDSKMDIHLNTLAIVPTKAIAKVAKGTTTNTLIPSSTNVLFDGKKLNVMTYFKLKWKTDPKSVAHIISQDEIDAVFNEKNNALEIASKKKAEDVLSCKATLLYKNLIKGNTNRDKTLKSMKEMEYSNNIVVDPEIIENIINEDIVADDTVSNVDDNADDEVAVASGSESDVEEVSDAESDED